MTVKLTSLLVGVYCAATKTFTVCGPGLRLSGILNINLVGEIELGFHDFCPDSDIPMYVADPEVKPLPIKVTAVPTGPEEGDIEVICGRFVFKVSGASIGVLFFIERT